MSLDPKDFFEPIEGEPLRDILGHLQNSNIRREMARTNENLDQVASLLRQQQNEQERLHRLPQCPYCGGRLDGQFELCRHCKSRLSYVDGFPCKPGQEREFGLALARERARIEHEEYLNQKLELINKNGIEFVQFKCICGKLLATDVKNIGSMKTCPSCKRELEVLGKIEYDKYLEQQLIHNKESRTSILIILGFVAIMLALAALVSQ